MGSSFPSWSSVSGTTGTGSSNSGSSVVGTISRAASSSDADSVFFSASVSNSCEAAGNASNVITHLYWTVLSPRESICILLAERGRDSMILITRPFIIIPLRLFTAANLRISWSFQCKRSPASFRFVLSHS